MEFVFEFVFQVILELLIQLLFEVLGEFGMRSLGDTFRKPRHPVFSTIGFTIWGVIAGGVSLLIFPNSAIHDPSLRRLNLVVTPIVAGLTMAAIGRARASRGQDLIRLDQFGFAFVFALAMAITRFVWAA